MAAAALLRSMARKLARAPPPHPRPLLAGGLHGSARSGPSLPPPTSNQIRQGSGDGLVVGMDAAAGLRSGAALPSLAIKIARAPQHRHILNRGLHSGSTAPPASEKAQDKIIEDLRLQLRQSRAAAGIGGVILSGLTIYGYFWLLPPLKKMRDRSVAFERLERELRDIIRAGEDEPRSVALAQIIQTAGHMNQQRNGTTEKGTGVSKLEEELIAVCSDILKEMRADLEEFRAATARTSKSAPLEQKEGCSRVGSETVQNSLSPVSQQHCIRSPSTLPVSPLATAGSPSPPASPLPLPRRPPWSCRAPFAGSGASSGSLTYSSSSASFVAAAASGSGVSGTAVRGRLLDRGELSSASSPRPGPAQAIGWGSSVLVPVATPARAPTTTVELRAELELARDGDLHDRPLRAVFPGPPPRAPHRLVALWARVPCAGE